MARAALNTYFEMEHFGDVLLEHIKCFKETKNTDMTSVANYLKDYYDVIVTGKNYIVIKNNKEDIENNVNRLLQNYFGKELFIRTKFDKDNNLIVRL